jgi:hypothetical protein
VLHSNDPDAVSAVRLVVAERETQDRRDPAADLAVEPR